MCLANCGLDLGYLIKRFLKPAPGTDGRSHQFACLPLEFEYVRPVLDRQTGLADGYDLELP